MNKKDFGATGDFNVKTEIMAAIAKTDDPNMKMAFLLMLGILEEIGGKIDSLRQDEKWLRETVLNGHAHVHDDDHTWIAAQRKAQDEAARANLNSKTKIRDGLIEKALWAVLVLAASSGWWLK
jgi:hypothetical protein